MKTGTKAAVNVWGRSKLHQMRQPVCLLGFRRGIRFDVHFHVESSFGHILYTTKCRKASFSVNVYFLGREGEFLRNAKR